MKIILFFGRIFCKSNQIVYLCNADMRIFTEQTITEYAEKHPQSRVALQQWAKKVKRSSWKSFADIKKSFNSVDAVGNQRFVFNIKGNDYRLVVVIRFTVQFVYIRFIGTHSEYNKINAEKV